MNACSLQYRILRHPMHMRHHITSAKRNLLDQGIARYLGITHHQWFAVQFNSVIRQLSRLPPARVRTAVHVQHLSGDVTSFSEVNDSIGNVLRFRDNAHG